MHNESFENVVPDTSVIIEGLLSERVEAGKTSVKEIVVHEAVLAELEHQSNQGKAIGFLGLDEIKRLRVLSEKSNFTLAFKGIRPNAAEIRHASLGEIDALVRQLAYDEDATLLTSDKVQSEVALARGIKVHYHKPAEKALRKLKLEKFFDEITMSVHLRENVMPYAKKGMPGKWEFVSLRKKVLGQEEIQDISREIIEEAKLRKDSFIEIERFGSTIVQLGSYRIVITRPPFSDGWEITAVRPVKRLSLEDYKLSEKLMKRVGDQAEGVLVAGAPGMGKCHGKGTPILMYSGKIKKVEEIKMGDAIMGPDSKPRLVLNTTVGYGKLYKVKPVKGNSYIVNEDHILSLKYSNHAVEKTVNVSVKEFIGASPHFRFRCKGYRTAVEYEKKETPIDPYFLGIWLGDGLSESVRVANCEDEIINYMTEYAQENGLVLRQHSNKDGSYQTYGITQGQRGGVTANPLLTKMRSLNLLSNKHIPKEYKINDSQTRLELLAGLVDSDGYLYANCYEIVTKFEKLHADILYLTRSLGFAAYSTNKYVGDKKYFRIRISGNISGIPTKVKRKKGKARQQIKNALRTGIRVEPIGFGAYYGFELSGDGLYCLGDFTVTHNSTFAQGLAEFYANQEKIVKTVEAPRDLVLPDNITQYAISHGDAQEIHDILLLSRPDYTLFDEMRNTDDFKLFADMRLAGVGMVGVVHATNPVDAIQRFIGRVEMGVIPQVIDTVLFIKNGAVEKVLSLEMTVKVPSGMTEADLARPVVVINDFESGSLLYEIYSYGEQTVVVPVKKEGAAKSIHKLASSTIEDEFRKYTRDAHVDVLSDHKAIVYVPERDISKIIGKQGKTIDAIEQKLGLSIDIQPLETKETETKKANELQYDIEMKKNNIVFHLDIKMQHKDVDLYLGDEFLMTAKAGKTGLIKVKKSNNVGQIISGALQQGKEIKLYA